MSGALRVAVVSNLLPPEPGGGMAAAHDHLIRLLRRAGHQVKGFTFSSARAGEDIEAGVTRRGPPDWAMRAIRSGMRGWFRLVDHGAVAYQSADALRFAWGAARLRAPLRRFAPQLLVVPDHSAPMLMLPRLPGCRHLLVCHHNPMRFLGEPLLGRYSEKDARLAVALEQRALAKIDRVVCPSRYMAGVFARTFRFAGPVSVIPNLVDTVLLDGVEPRDLRSILGLPADAAVVYVPSAGSKYKGSRYVFEILRRLAARGSIGFYLSGEVGGQTAHELTFLPEGAKVHAPGHVSNHDNLALVKGCDFAVSPTLVENFSMALLEALACGLPAVTFDVGGNAEMITDGESGALVPPLDLEGLVARAEALLKPERRARLAASTRDSIRRRFDPDIWVGRWTEDSEEKRVC